MAKEISLVLGTAGHIDHGKTALVRALTGVDCDSLQQERKRGITIELGFAPLTLPSKRVISVIDVPGHEKFIRQMVAGASGLDAVVMVIAADEGVMPQTREHLDIIELLGVREGFVVLTKADLVDEEMLELAMDDVKELIAGTFLEGRPVIAVSSTEGTNLNLVKDELDRLVDTVPQKSREGAFFMPIDRSFPVAGFGTVVTGTAYRGAVQQGYSVDILPAGIESRVRSIQVHGSSVNSAQAGQRVAMSLTGLSVDDMSRGDVVCASGVFKSTTCLDVSFRILKGSPEPLSHWQRVRVHLGTSDVLARVALLGKKELAQGDFSVGQLVLEEPVVASLGQSFVIRFYSPLRTIGGGVVLSPYGRKAHGKKAREAAIARLESLAVAKGRRDMIVSLVNFYERISLDELIVQVQETRSNLLEMIKSLQKEKKLYFLNVGNGVVFSFEEVDRKRDEIIQFIALHHETHPNQKGLASDKLVNHLFPEDERKTGRVFVDNLVSQKDLVLQEGVLALPGFMPEDDEDFKRKLQSLMSLCDKAGFQPPTFSEVSEVLGMKDREFSHFIDDLKEMEILSVVDGTFLLSRDIEVKLLKILREVEGGITIGNVRDITGSSRKFVLPLLEYFDRKGITRRVGDKRIILGN